MRRINLAAALVAAFFLAGCAGTPLGDLIRTGPIANPVTVTNIYQVENGYAAALTAADEYRTYCYARPYRVLMADPVAKALCARRRAVVGTILTYGPKAGKAIETAKTFVQQNPTLNASAVIGLASIAVADFRRAIPTK